MLSIRLGEYFNDMLTFYTDDDGERLGDAVAGGLTDALYAVIGFGIPTAIVAVAIALAILLHWAWAFLSLLAFVYLALFMSTWIPDGRTPHP